MDIGVRDNLFLRLQRENAARLVIRSQDAEGSVAVDKHARGGGCLIIDSPADLAFLDGIFDTVTIVAAINHSPERRAAFAEVCRVLKPGGHVPITTTSRFVGTPCHAIRWFSEEEHRYTDPGELAGMNSDEVVALLLAAVFDSSGSGNIHGEGACEYPSS